MKKTITIIIFIGLISLISSYYAGDTVNFDNPLGDNLVWTIIDNSSVMTIIPEITINSTNISIHFPSNMPPESFTIVFIKETTKEVVKKVYVGGSGHSHYSSPKLVIPQPLDNYSSSYPRFYTETNESNQTKIGDEVINDINRGNIDISKRIIMVSLIIILILLLYKYFILKNKKKNLNNMIS